MFSFYNPEPFGQLKQLNPQLGQQDEARANALALAQRLIQDEESRRRKREALEARHKQNLANAQQSQSQSQSSQPQIPSKLLNKVINKTGLFGSEASTLGTSGNMGMGSDAASLAYAEASAGAGAGASAGTGAGAGAGTGTIPTAGASSTAGGTGGTGSALGIASFVAAAIAAQHALSNNTDTVYEGVKTDDAFSGHFGTEPWLAWAHDKLGLDPTAGERFDAALDNGDYGLALRRSLAMSDYWADPVHNWANSAMEAVNRKVVGKDVAKKLNPSYWFEKILG